jgi:serine/threonine protein kinase
MPVSGHKLGPYEILAPLGKGGMGEVWRARDARPGRDIAVKIADHRFSDRFEREAPAIAALNHPNICLRKNRIIDAQAARSCRLPTERRKPALRRLSAYFFGTGSEHQLNLLRRL